MKAKGKIFKNLREKIEKKKSSKSLFWKSVVFGKYFLGWLKNGLPYNLIKRTYPLRKRIYRTIQPEKELDVSTKIEIQHFIERNQSAQRDKFIIYIFRENVQMFGAALFWIKNALNQAIATSRILIMAEDDDWVLVPDKQKANWEYYFEKISPFSEKEILKRYKPEEIADIGNGAKNAPILYYRKPNFFTDIYYYIPNRFHVYGFDAWEGELVKYMYKPKKWIKDYINKRYQEFNLGKDFIAFHVRRGDKIRGPFKEDRLVPLKKYFKEACRIRKHTGINRIFIATDDPSVIDEILADNHEFEIIYDPHEIRRDGFGWKYNIAKEIERKDALDETLTAFKNIYVLTKAKYLIGSQASFFFQIAQCLRKNEVDNTISLSENIKFFDLKRPL